MSRGDILLTIMQVAGGGVIGFFVGLWLGRKQVQYQHRIGVVAEMRQRLREARESFANMSTPPKVPAGHGAISA